MLSIEYLEVIFAQITCLSVNNHVLYVHNKHPYCTREYRYTYLLGNILQLAVLHTNFISDQWMI